MAKKNTELTTTSGFAALADNQLLQDILADEYAGLEFSFDRLKMMGGGGTMFEAPSEDGEGTEMVKDITGVIVYNHPAYAYYAAAFTGGHAAPDCSSIDGVMGTGNPGGDCRVCPFNQFGSGDGQSKLCKNRRMLYILKEGELFPVALSLPTGSLKSFTNYVKRQLTRGRRLSQIVTKITLKKATNSTGIPYSQAVFSFERMLSPEEVTVIAGVTESAKAYAASLPAAIIADDEIAEGNMPMVDPETGEVTEALN